MSAILRVMREGMREGKAQREPGCKWKRCRFRDNGDGTATVLIGHEAQVRGKWTFIGKMHTLAMTCVKETNTREH